MFICRKSRSALKLVSHLVQETYCAVGQQIGERLEALSYGLAAQRYRCEIRSQRFPTFSISRRLAAAGNPAFGLSPHQRAQE